MKIATIISTGAVALTIFTAAALAQQARNGLITGINRLNNTIAIRQIQNGTVGASAGDAAEEFKVQSGVSLDDWHAGDRVSFTATETGKTKTITKLQKPEAGAK
ncbi:MAG TPA: copper-binding protein [Bradyrhizobium sp.]|nr:copper-binding protein [Bradyrhizobium sp.]